jgi:hypothetical protein
MQNVPLVIFSGSNERAVITFCRYAEKLMLDYVIIANGNDDSILVSYYKSKVLLIRPKNQLNLSDFLKYMIDIKKYFNINRLFIIPITEYLNRFLLQNWKSLEAINISFGLCNSELYTSISDKYSFGNLCNSFGILIPKEFNYKPDKIPYVIKPKKYYNENNVVNIKPIIINNDQEADLVDLNTNDIYYQEFIGGKSIYFLFYFSKNGLHTVYSQENLIQQHDGGSMILCKSSNYHLNTEIVNKLVKLFKDNKFSGLVMVEMKLYNEKFYMIEANPRPWGPLQLTINSKMTIIDDFFIDNGLINFPIFNKKDYKVNTYYFWSGGINKTLDTSNNLCYHDFSESTFINEYNNIIKNEIYLNTDTIKIYLKENL